MRASAEERHYGIVHRAFLIPICVYPVHTWVSASGEAVPKDVSSFSSTASDDNGHPPSLDAQWTRPMVISDPFQIHSRGRSLSRFTGPCSGDTFNTTLDDLRLFRWKDVVIYVNAGVQYHIDQKALFDQIYREWFPHRAEDKDVSDAAFWAIPIRFRPPGVLFPSPETAQKSLNLQEIGFAGVKGLWQWHTALGIKLRELEEEEIREREIINTNTSSTGSSSAGGPASQGSSLRQSLHDVLVVLEGDWQKDGVYLVWKDAETAKLYNCTATGKGIESGNGVEECQAQDWQPGCAFRCSLKRAMQITVSRDPYRVEGKPEWNEQLEETLGGEDEDGS